jgi:hypothetical protein
MKMSWGVLMKDKELIFFPIFAAIGLGVLLAIFFGLGTAFGTLDRFASETDPANLGDIIFVVFFFFCSYFITIFFNAALISAALERLRGGDPNVSSGLSHALSHIHTILGWAIIAATVGLVLMLLRSRSNNFLTRLVIDMIGGAWEFMTFFVVPVLVSEGLGPVAAIKRSASLIRQTWGRQITASFGFMLVYVLAALLGILPAILFGLIEPVAGIAVGLITVSAAMGAVQAMEGIFKAALYEYALGERPAEFDLRTLQTAYRPAPSASPA